MGTALGFIHEVCWGRIFGSRHSTFCAKLMARDKTREI
jgi:hypothetical protein